ncbi:tyrosinase family oxidase copper chaperone [Streptomyces sp. NPDC000134]|uniref:tyrosinase family oxidase copper chaperone n=1 Tax=Streptomyces sp. NPDC000134 TaxID=3364536 RepID=UPI0036B2341F
MVVSAGGTPRNTGRQPAGRERGGPPAATRRSVVRGLLAPALALPLTSLAAAAPPGGGASDEHDRGAFDEHYRGRRVQGAAAPAGGWHVTVDGRPLPLMRRADGTWLSTVDHYGSYPTPLAAARAAVDELGPGQRLRTTTVHGGHGHQGGHHGVPA